MVLLDIAYGMPIVVNCLRGRNMLPERPFVLPNIVGWIANAVSCFYGSFRDENSSVALGLPCLHFCHHCALLVPSRPPRIGQQHEYVLMHCNAGLSS